MARQEDEHTEAFLRMTAIQVRELAEAEPRLAHQLLHIARQLDAEAADIERRVIGDPTGQSISDDRSPGHCWNNASSTRHHRFDGGLVWGIGSLPEGPTPIRSRC